MFWQLSPSKLEPFAQAYRKKYELETEDFREKTNFAAWLQGIYFTRAIAVNFNKNAQYFNEPINLLGQDDNAEKELAAKATKFEAWAAAFNRGFSKKETES
ncbi:MAG: hypothetical protein LBI03_09220 [Clostridiales bacterium]|nr:hypothetical protein [Clostridiales bacterium]